jgi:hypothetical protein
MQLHQWGDQEYDVGFPARPFAVVQPEDADALGHLAGRWWDRHARRAGF